MLRRFIRSSFFSTLWVVGWILFIIGAANLLGETFNQTAQNLWLIAFGILTTVSAIQLAFSFWTLGS
jgi:uncharacterized membrane protein